MTCLCVSHLTGSPPAAESHPESEAAASPAGASAEKWVIADFDFTSADKGDLPFKKGTRIKVLEEEGGWWLGELDGETGMFPANYTHSE